MFPIREAENNSSCTGPQEVICPYPELNKGITPDMKTPSVQALKLPWTACLRAGPSSGWVTCFIMLKNIYGYGEKSVIADFPQCCLGVIHCHFLKLNSNLKNIYFLIIDCSTSMCTPSKLFGKPFCCVFLSLYSMGSLKRPKKIKLISAI